MRALRRSVALAALITGAWALQVSPVFAFHRNHGAGGGNQRNGARPRHPWGQRNELRSGAGGSADENLHLLSHAAQRVSARFEWPGWRLGSPKRPTTTCRSGTTPWKRTPSSRCTTRPRRADYRATGKPGDPHRHHDSGQHLAPLYQLSRREHRREFLGQLAPE